MRKIQNKKIQEKIIKEWEEGAITEEIAMRHCLPNAEVRTFLLANLQAKYAAKGKN